MPDSDRHTIRVIGFTVLLAGVVLVGIVLFFVFFNDVPPLSSTLHTLPTTTTVT